MTTHTKQTVITILTLLSIVVSLIGLADAGYITYEKYSGKIPVCGEGFDCGAVLNSPWAYIGPFPVSAFGMLFYISMLSLGILYYVDAPIKSLKKQIQTHFTALTNNLRKSKSSSPSILALISNIDSQIQSLSWQTIAFLIAIPGLLFTFYLLFIMGVVLKSWCFYCLISAASTITLFSIHSILYIVNKS